GWGGGRRQDETCFAGGAKRAYHSRRGGCRLKRDRRENCARSTGGRAHSEGVGSVRGHYAPLNSELRGGTDRALSTSPEACRRVSLHYGLASLRQAFGACNPERVPDASSRRADQSLRGSRT